MYQYNKYFYKYTLSFIHNVISKYLQTRKGLTIPNGKNEEKNITFTLSLFKTNTLRVHMNKFLH